MNVLTSREFDEWYFEYFGDTRFLGGRLWELRWRNGRRVYYTVLVDKEGKEALMFLGGDKNGQDRDIAHARTILEREAS